MNKPKGSPVKKGGSGDTALNFVRNKVRKETGRPEGQRKKVKGERIRKHLTQEYKEQKIL